MAKEYFAAPSDPTKLGGNLWAKVEEYGSWAAASEFIDTLNRAYLYYNGRDFGGAHVTSQVTRGGEVGELAEIRVNHSRALVQTLFNLIAAAKISWQAVATNSDYSSMAQVDLAHGVLDYYWQEGKAQQASLRALEECIPLTESFVLTEWDDTLGEMIGADEAGPVFTGDIRFTNVMSWDVLRDPRKQSYDELDWVIVRVRRNKWNLAVKYLQARDEVLNASETVAGNLSTVLPYRALSSNDNDVPVHIFLHKPSLVLPQGRKTVFVSAKGVLEDGPLDTPFWPLHRCHHSELFGTPFAYSPYLEILGVQELVDSLETAIASNQSTFAAQLIAMTEGSEINVDALGGGFKAIYIPVGGQPPQPLQLTRSPAEVFPHVKDKKKDMELLMGLNSVVRGEPLTGDQSGAALALLQAQAVQQSSGLQANYLRFVQSIGNAILQLIQTRCPIPRKIAISGKANKFLQKETEITGASIGQIKKVMIEIGNPMAQTASGRVLMAKELLANQLVKTPEQYIQVIETGRLEPLTQSVQNELLLIAKENEQILNGQQPLASIDDDHMLHAREHRGVMANPDARLDPGVVVAYQAHILEHEQLFYTADPRRLMLMGQQPAPMMPPPGGPEAAAAGVQQTPGAGAPADLPSMPTNPSNGEPAPMPDGAVLAKPGPAPGPKGPQPAAVPN